jgi:hypothetical protein
VVAFETTVRRGATHLCGGGSSVGLWRQQDGELQSVSADGGDGGVKGAARVGVVGRGVEFQYVRVDGGRCALATSWARVALVTRDREDKLAIMWGRNKKGESWGI